MYICCTFNASISVFFTSFFAKASLALTFLIFDCKGIDKIESKNRFTFKSREGGY